MKLQNNRDEKEKLQIPPSHLRAQCTLSAMITCYQETCHGCVLQHQ